MKHLFEQATGADRSAEAPDPEVTAKAKRRRFTGEYKLRILREADARVETGGVGEMLRREGLYSSHLSTWRRERERGELNGLAPKKRGRKANPDTVLTQENERLARRVARLEKRLAQAEAIIDVQKKVASLLGIPLNRHDDDGSDS
jgi:transposase-like protein